MLNVIRYASSEKEEWDAFVKQAKNGHFMFQRDYMDYHSDKFIDHSLLFELDNRVVAILPANKDDSSLISHGGLSFGGVLCSASMKARLMLDIFQKLHNYCRQNAIDRIVYKSIPFIYSAVPAEEDLYALHLHGARIFRRDISTAISYGLRLPFSKQTKRNISKAQRNNLSFNEGVDLAEYWALLSDTLRRQHNTKPVHKLEEISALHERFPDNIRLYEIRSQNGQLLAGTLLFINNGVVHTQYLANSDQGRKIGALDYLIASLIEKYSTFRYFSFGISTTNNGKTLNEGLIRHKEGFGGRGIVHDFYVWEIK